MTKKFLLGLATCLLMSIGTNAWADLMYGDYTYTESGGEITITGYTGSGGDIVLPETIEDMPVENIRGYAFHGLSSLTTVIIPDCVTSIGVAAFASCRSLINLTVDENNSAYSSLDGVLYNKDKTILLAYPGGKPGKFNIPGSVNTITRNAFYGCIGLTSVTIPGSVNTITSNAFYGCSDLTSVIIPDSVTTIGERAFNGCSSLTSVTIPDSVTTIGERAFDGCSSATNLTISSNITSIDELTFAYCTSLTSVVIPDSITSIGRFAFYGCTDLTSITLGSNVTTIEDRAFSHCESLTSIIIPESVTNIGGPSYAGGSVFSSSYSLTSIVVDANNSAYSSNDGVLYNKDKTVLIAYPGGKSTAFTAPGSLLSIGDYAFYGCSGLTSATIPDSVIHIGHQAFRYCSNLTSVTIPGSVTIIEYWAFHSCNALSVAYFLGNAPSIEHEVFFNTAPDFHICYTAEATGFTSSTWAEYPAEACACNDHSDCDEGEVCVYGGCSAATMPVKDTGDPNERTCNPASYTDLGNGIVRDNVTGLEWVQDGNLIETRDPSFDNDGTAGNGLVTWQHALDYVDQINAEEYLGYSDWRLPTIEELETLVDGSRDFLAIDPLFSSQNGSYWSATNHAEDTEYAWSVNFYYGGVANSNKSTSKYVRAVRGEQYESLNTFIINDDGTVIDKNTGLIWQQCNYGQTWGGSQCTYSAATRTWDEAVAYIQQLNDALYLGSSDWRLPTRSELQSLLDYSQFAPATIFPNTRASWYWSSTMNPSSTEHAWLIDFSKDGTFSFFKSESWYVRAVRGGPCLLNGDWCIDDSGCSEGEVCMSGSCEPAGDSDIDSDGIINAEDNCPNIANPLQEDAESDGTGDLCDTDTVYGTIAGAFTEETIVSINKTSCGAPNPIAQPSITPEGYYSYGGLENGQYAVTVFPNGIGYSSDTLYFAIPQAVIQSYDFTVTAD